MRKALIILVAVAIGFGLSFMFPCGADEYIDDDTPAMSADIVDHDQAMLLCERLGLEYDYEAEGTNPLDFCR